MNTPIPQDPLAALKKSSPDDPIIPAMEHINNHLDTMKSHAKSIARDATSLRNTRKLIFFIACLISAGGGSAGTWYALRGSPSPDIQILRSAGIEVRVTDANKEVKIAFVGSNPTPSFIAPTATSKGVMMFTWSKK